MQFLKHQMVEMVQQAGMEIFLIILLKIHRFLYVVVVVIMELIQEYLHFVGATGGAITDVSFRVCFAF